MRSDQLLNIMKELGFTAYESKAYLTLLKHHPATRYELSKNSSVPRSAIYTIVQRLEEVGAVSLISNDPEKYIPLPPKNFIRLLKNRYQSRLDEFDEQIASFEVDPTGDNFWHVSGYENTILKAKELIDSATSTIYLSAWGAEVYALESQLRAAVNRGIKVIIFSFNTVPDIGRVFSYGIEAEKLATIWEPKLILIRDLTELVMGEMNRAHPRKAIWTDNRCFVNTIADQIIMDIMLYSMRTGQALDESAIAKSPGEVMLIDQLLKEKLPDQTRPEEKPVMLKRSS